MYKEYFGLKQSPFKITPDTTLFFPGANRGAVLQALTYAVTSGEGIVKVVGEVGSGKTMLCRMLEDSLPNDVEVVYLANPSLTPENLLHAIGFEMNLDVEPADPQLKAMHKIQDYLVDQHANNKRVVMFVEEAQSMPIETLEELRLLSNLETKQDKLLQIVLFGQPELDENLSKQHIRQLKERITYSFNLAPLQEYEVRDYMNSRMRASGYQGMDLFDPKAVKEIWKHSGGLLRRINILGDKACLAAYAENDRVVTLKHVKTAVNDSDFSSMPGIDTDNSRYLIILALVILLILIAGTAWWYDNIRKNPVSQNQSLQENAAQNSDPNPYSKQTELSTSTWEKLDQEITSFE
ncbi:MAG: ExeA family protein [Gammaproteobacteria bacterium]